MLSSSRENENLQQIESKNVSDRGLDQVDSNSPRLLIQKQLDHLISNDCQTPEKASLDVLQATRVSQFP